MKRLKIKNITVILLAALLAIVLVLAVPMGANVTKSQAEKQLKTVTGNFRSLNGIPETINPNLFVNGTFAINTSGKTSWTNPAGTLFDYFRVYSDTPLTVKLNLQTYSLDWVFSGTTGSGYSNLYCDGISLPAGEYTASFIVSHPNLCAQVIGFGGGTKTNFKRDGNIVSVNVKYTTSTPANTYFGLQVYPTANTTVKLYGIKVEQGNTSSAPFGMENKELIYEEGYNKGKNDGLTEGYQSGIEATRNEIFSSASLVSVKMENGTSLNAPLNVIAKGIGFTSIAKKAEDYTISNNLDGADARFTVVFNVMPFLFSKNQIYISRSMGFYSLVFVDEGNTKYNMEWDSETHSEDGYAIYAYKNDTIYQKKIKQIQITFMSYETVGSLIVPQSSSTKNAYETGYNQGYSKGYNYGFTQSSESMSGWNLISVGLSSVFEALDVKIFGFFSIADILTVVLVVGVVFFIFKLIRG